MDLVSTERDLLNQYTTTFSQQQTDLVAKYQTVTDRLTTSTQAENDETATLAQLQKQLDDLSLSATVDKFTQVKSDLAAKFQAYTDIVQSNNAVATTLYTKLQDSKDVIGQISDLLKDIDTTINQINSTIDTYSNAAAPAPVAAVPVVADAPVVAPVDTPVVAVASTDASAPAAASVSS